MLVLEYIEGIKIDDISALKKQKHNINKITEVATEVFFLQVFRDGFFHGDMHPGNIFIDKKGNACSNRFWYYGKIK